MDASSSGRTTLGAVFETRPVAEAALERLRGEGFSEGETSLASGPVPGVEGERNLIDGLLDLFMPSSAGAGSDTGGDHSVMVGDVTPERREAAARLLDNAGALHIYERAGGAERWTRLVWRTEDAGAKAAQGTPRPVQPGFADAPPGFVPDPAPYPAVRAAGEPQRPQEIAEGKGRFAEQLDQLSDRAQPDRTSTPKAEPKG